MATTLSEDQNSVPFSCRSAAADSAKEMAALRAADQNWAKAYNAGNADAVASLYDEQAVLLPPGAPGVKGARGRAPGAGHPARTTSPKRLEWAAQA
jgi:hypothetical protein